MLIPYSVFVFTGTLQWSILIEALNAPIMLVNANKALLAKISFPSKLCSSPASTKFCSMPPSRSVSCCRRIPF